MSHRVHSCIPSNISFLAIDTKSKYSKGLGLQGLYSATNCADNILGRFTIILQNQIARVDSFTNLTKRWVFRFRLNASILSHNLISFGKQFHARGPYTANARLPKVSCLNFGTFRTRSSSKSINGCIAIYFFNLLTYTVENIDWMPSLIWPLPKYMRR